MSDKNYFKTIAAKAGYIAKYSRFFSFLVVIAYLVYLEILVVNVFSAVNYVPSIAEVKAKFSPIMAKNETINSIEGYFLDKQNSLYENLQKGTMNNPFVPRKTDEPNSINNTIIPENSFVN